MSAGFRIAHLDSIRGLAAVQVLLLHVFSAFAPALVFNVKSPTLAGFVHRSPAFFAYDGYSAVYIFFALSGYVLTFAFEPYLDHPFALVCGRTIRLMVPAACACALSLCAKMLFGSPNIPAGDLTGSTEWLSTNWLPLDGLLFFVRDAFVNSTFLGYQGTSILPAGWLDPITNAYVAPLWTLSVEMQGSILILALCTAYERGTAWWLAALTVALLVAGRTHFVCFAAGHCLAVAHMRRRFMNLRWAVGPFLILVGIGLCVTAERGRFSVFSTACALDAPFMAHCAIHIQKIYGAILVFVGILSSKALLRLLEANALTYLGRISFSLYLVHWPIVFGAGSLIILLTADRIGIAAAALCASVAVIAASLGAAHAFMRLDEIGIGLSRSVRRALAGRQPPPPMGSV